MTFSEAVSFISEAEKYGIIPGLDSMKRLCNALSNPQNNTKFIHIAGTNGKGSTGTFLNSILSDAGYKTGRYISPAVMDYLEKIQYDGHNINEEDFAYYTAKVKSATESIISKGFPHPTVFEIETAIAFCCFAEMNCDIVLLEVGMGGRSDATNIIKNSLISVITSISLEHTQFLGNTLEKIAYEKAGIIKQSGNVITLNQNSEVINTIRDECIYKSASLTIADTNNIRDFGYYDGIQYFSYKDYEKIKLQMLGKFQTENAILALEACQLLKQYNFEIAPQNIYNGLYNAKWPGRFEIIKQNNPTVILDGAHNISAAKRLNESIDIFFSNKKITFVIGVFKDKNYREIAELTAKKADRIFTVSPPGKRGLNAEELAETIKQYNPDVVSLSGITEVVNKIKSETCDVVIVFGSLSFLGEVKKYFNGE